MSSVSLSKDRPGQYKLVLAGESQGSSSNRAQAGFLALKAKLAQSPFLLERANPVTLKMTEDSDRRGEAKVSFSLEYKLRGKAQG